MKKLVLLPPLLLGSTACLSLDFMFLDGRQVDRYTFDPELVPEELVELVDFDRGDGTLLKGVWARQPDTPTGAPPLVYLHGVSGNLEDNFDRIAWLWSWGTHDVFAPDYSGFGASEGDPTWANLADKDGHATLSYVSDTTGVPVDGIPVIALSLGGFVALHTVDELPVEALVLQSVFANSDLLLDTSLRLDVPPGFFFADDWENDRAIRELDNPVLVIDGLDDDFVDPSSGPILFDAAPDPKELWQPAGVGHADLFQVEPDAYRERATTFLEAWDR